MKGNIFNIQKFSIHDGPGVRTTVFLKGCPLRCQWCANPESQSAAIQVSYDAKKCIRCRTCVHTCTHDSIKYVPGCGADMEADRILIDHDKCAGCLACVNNCPAKALGAEGEMMDLQQVLYTCLQDIDFYEESGGGVTLSGGECMCQPAFTEALIAELKTHHIHVAAETTGYIDSKVFRRLAPMFDLLLFDVKHCDPDRHFAGTGVRNEQIIENLTWAFDQGLPILPRIPVIPGFNAEPEDAEGLSDLLVKVGLKEAQLLPFHQFGERKYELLNQAYSFKNVKALYPEDLAEYQQIFLNKGIHCFI